MEHPAIDAQAVDGSDAPGPGNAGWHVYIVRCVDGTLYTGVSTDTDKRVSEHNRGRGARYTRSRRPVELVYLEPAASRGDALRREREIKRMSTSAKHDLVSERIRP
jgi:putative endonuclease